MVRKVKHILVTSLVFLIIIFMGVLWYTRFYEPVKEKKIITRYAKNTDPSVLVVKAKKAIPKGIVIKEDMLKLETVSAADVMENYASGLEQVVGKTSAVELYANEQIGFNKITVMKDFEPSDRYIEVDIPVENFVNNNVDIGSIVDILIDYRNGKYDVVLSKVSIFERKPVSPPLSGQSVQQGQLQQNSQAPQSGQSPQPPQSDRQSNAAGRVGNDRITIIVNEKEQKRLWQAVMLGKLDTRLYVDEGQPPSIVTFVSEEENQAKMPQ